MSNIDKQLRDQIFASFTARGYKRVQKIRAGEVIAIVRKAHPTAPFIDEREVLFETIDLDSNHWTNHVRAMREIARECFEHASRLFDGSAIMVESTLRRHRGYVEGYDECVDVDGLHVAIYIAPSAAHALDGEGVVTISAEFLADEEGS